MLRSALAAAVVVNIGGRTDKTDLINQALDFAIDAITRAHEWKSLELETDVSTAGTALTFTDAVWDVSELTLTKTSAFTSYTFAAGDHIYVSAGTGVTVGWYKIASKDVSNNFITLTESFAAADTSVTATMIGNPEYIALPAGTLHALRVRLMDGTSSSLVRIKSKRWLQARWPDVTAISHGTPLHCYEDLSQGTYGRLYFYPVPDDIYTYRLTTTAYQGSFSGASDTADVPGLDNAIVAWATAYSFQSCEQFSNAQIWYGYAQQAVIAAIQADKRDHPERSGETELEPTTMSAEPWNDPFVMENP
jgi:hypothetical protein